MNKLPSMEDMQASISAAWDEHDLQEYTETCRKSAEQICILLEALIEAGLSRQEALIFIIESAKGVTK